MLQNDRANIMSVITGELFNAFRFSAGAVRSLIINVTVKNFHCLKLCATKADLG